MIQSRRLLSAFFVLILMSSALFLPAQLQAGATNAHERILLDPGWKFVAEDLPNAQTSTLDDSQWRTVNLPHDWSIEGTFDKNNPMSGPGGFLPSGVSWYRRAFDVPAGWSDKSVVVEFEGVYMNATVYLNGEQLATHPYGYTTFFVDLSKHLKVGARNLLAVRVDNSQQLNSRWYSGSGIYRHVRLHVRNHAHVADWGVFVTTPSVTEQAATVRVSTRLTNEAAKAAKLTLETVLFTPKGAEAGRATLKVPVGADSNSEVTQNIKVARPSLWSPETPALYRAVTRISSDGRVIDEVRTNFGIRTLSWSAEKGFLLNGKSIKLAGGAIHHDNGALGAAAFDRAEERKIQLLKDAGFNAIRTAHNPPSPALLDAADRLGMLVIDEAFDCWEKGKNKFDYSVVFKDWWQRDIDAMVLRDRNHPSVIMWSIGNEVNERATPDGKRIGQMLADRVRMDDPTRPITAGIQTPGKNWEDTDYVFSVLDIAGYNYQMHSHESDHRRDPRRIMVATESFSHDMFKYWEYANDNPYIIGDFVWTAIDYLGESAIGRAAYYGPGEKEPRDWFDDIYPWHGSYCGDLDLAGFRKPRSHYRNIVWGRGEKLYMAVHEPVPEGKKLKVTRWGEAPSIASWSWPGNEGKELQVDVYSSYDRVRLYLNDKVVGESATTRAQEFRAQFQVPYSPGTLKVVGLSPDGTRELEQFVLRTAAPAAKVRLKPDRGTVAADGQDLSFVNIEVTDADGNPQPNYTGVIHFTVSGPGVLAGVDNGQTANEEPYNADHRRVFEGRALAIVRTTSTAGDIQLEASAPGLGTQTITIHAVSRGGK